MQVEVALPFRVDGRAMSPGMVVDVPDASAQVLIAKKFVRPVADKSKPKRAGARKDGE
jgi:hypothetical protein